jgi:hypothetical protein
MSREWSGIENVGRPTVEQAEAKQKAREIFTKRFDFGSDSAIRRQR